MHFYKRFVPGNWVDSIDTNDFVNLNKKPFFEEPLFLEKPTHRILELINAAKRIIEEESDAIDLSFSSIEHYAPAYLSKKMERLPGIPSDDIIKEIGYSESSDDMRDYYAYKNTPVRSKNRKTVYEKFELVSSSEIKKTLKMGIFKMSPSSFTPGYCQPDFRRVVLYGTKRLIQEKQRYMKKLEKHLQNTEWVQRRLSLHVEIESLKKLDRFAKHFNRSLKKPAENAVDAFSYYYISLLASFIENPSVPFVLSQVTTFLDIYLEKEIEDGTLSESDAQSLMDEFYIKLSLFRFIPSPNFHAMFESEPFPFGDTFDLSVITKSSYRLLHSIRSFRLSPFSIRLIGTHSIKSPIQHYLSAMIDEGLPMTFANTHLNHKQSPAISSFGTPFTPGQDYVFDSGVCDLEKVFYLALNGGKDLNTNLNLSPVTQPLRQAKMDYNEVLSKFKTFLSYVLSLYVEKMNVVLYLAETNHQHPIRNALMENIIHYKIQFSFSNVLKVSTYLHAIKEKTYRAQFDSNGWLQSLLVDDNSKKSVPASDLVELTQYIETEINRIPIYKKANSNLRFYLFNVFHIFNDNAIIKDMNMPIINEKNIFPLNITSEKGKDHFKTITHLMKNDFNEINYSIQKHDQSTNGLILKKNKQT